MKAVRLGEDPRAHLATIYTAEDHPPLHYRHVAETACGFSNLTSHGPINAPSASAPECPECKRRGKLG